VDDGVCERAAAYFCRIVLGLDDGEMIRPFVNETSSRICACRSHPAAHTAGVMNFVQMSRSLSDALSTLTVNIGRPVAVNARPA